MIADHDEDARPPASKGSGSEPRGRQNIRRRYRTSELFGDTSEIIIEHQEADYRLRVTSNGKLILTR